MANRRPRPAFNKPFHHLSPKQRVHYIDWVDQHYRAFFVGDVPRPGPRPASSVAVRRERLRAGGQRSPFSAVWRQNLQRQKCRFSVWE